MGETGRLLNNWSFNLLHASALSDSWFGMSFGFGLQTNFVWILSLWCSINGKTKWVVHLPAKPNLWLKWVAKLNMTASNLGWLLGIQCTLASLQPVTYPYLAHTTASQRFISIWVTSSHIPGLFVYIQLPAVFSFSGLMNMDVGCTSWDFYFWI